MRCSGSGDCVTYQIRDYSVTYPAAVDDVFRAISDPNRRLLLDLLTERDGQTLTELEARLDMTRFGVMRHLRVLEAAGLVTTHRAGRHKLHYLNPTPIQLVAERWISKYAGPVGRSCRPNARRRCFSTT